MSTTPSSPDSSPTPGPSTPLLAKANVVRLLLSLYPAAWRHEYGSELADILMARPLNARIIADVMWNALRQRVRLNDASTVVGATLALLIASSLASNIQAPLRDQNALFAGVLEKSSITLPTVEVTLFRSEPYFLLMAIVGCWTYLRRGRLSHSGLATTKITFIASLPILLTGFLILVGVVAPTAPDALAVQTA